MNKGLTVKELKKFCDAQIKIGNGDKHIQISSDDEGNGFHSLFYQFTSDKKEIQDCIDYGMMPYGLDDASELILLG